MARWKTGKPVAKHARVRLLANSRVNKNRCFSELHAQASHSELGKLAQVRLASPQKVGSWFAIDVFQSLGHHECTGQSDTKSQPSSVSFPGLPPKALRKRSTSGCGRPGYEDETDDSDDRRRTEDRDGDKHGVGDRFIF